MNRPLHNSSDAWQANRKPTAVRCVTAIVVVLALTGSLSLSGCSKSVPGLVPVSGKLTKNRGPWPKKGAINFTPLSTSAEHRVLPGMAHLEEDGSFTVLTPSGNGLMPGEYMAVVRCWLEGGDEHHAGKSAVPAIYGSPQTSPLKVTIPEGSGPIVLDWDIPAK